jgi:FkbM family methyltransferase
MALPKLKNLVKNAISKIVSSGTGYCVNGFRPLPSLTTFIYSNFDIRRKIGLPNHPFTIRAGTPVERWRAETLLTKEPETIEWLIETIEDGSVFYDIGANIGLYTLFAASLGKDNFQAVCFEPESQNFARLNQNIFDNKLSASVQAFSIGLNEKTIISRFPLSNFVPGAALHGASNISEKDAPHIQGLISMSLDDFLSRSPNLPDPTHIKIDVDGPEYEILLGAKNTLRMKNLKYVLVELNKDCRLKAIEQLNQYGFELQNVGEDEGGMANHIFKRVKTS